MGVHYKNSYKYTYWVSGQVTAELTEEKSLNKPFSFKYTERAHAHI